MQHHSKKHAAYSATLVLTLLSTLLLKGCGILPSKTQGSIAQDGVKGNGKVVTEERKVEDHEKLRLSGPIDLLLEKEEGPLRVRTDSLLLSIVRTEVEDRTLHIGLEEDIQNPARLEVILPVADLSTMVNEASGSIETSKKLRWGQLSIKNHGSGTIDLHLNAKTLRYQGDGSGDVRLKGKADRFLIEKEGSGDLLSSDLMAQELVCHSEGSGDLKLDATQELEIRSEGSGDVIYQKAPPNIKVEKEGSGDVRSAEQ